MRNRLAGIALATWPLAIPLPALAQAPAADSSWVTRSGLYEVFVQDFSVKPYTEMFWRKVGPLLEASAPAR